MGKILYIHHGKGIGGAPLSLLYLLDKIDRTRFHPIILFLYDSDVVDIFRQRNYEVHVTRGLYEFSHTTIEWYSIFYFHRFLHRIIYFIPSIYRSYRLVKNFFPDIVHLNSSTLTPCAIGAKLAGCKLVWHIREPLSKGYFGIRKLILKWLIEKFSDAIITISNYDARQLKRSNKIHFIPNFVDFKIFDYSLNGDVFREEYGVKEDVKTIGMLGGVTPVRGTLEFIKAISYVIKEDKSCFFFVIGDFPQQINFFKSPRNVIYWWRICKVIRREKLNEKIIFTGVRKDISRVIAGLDMVVFPSIIPQFGRPLIEAGAMKKPVVAWDLGGQNEIIVDNVTGKLVPPGNPKLLARAVLKIFQDKELTKSMGEEGYKRAKELYAANVNSQAVFRIYGDLIKKKGSF